MSVLPIVMWPDVRLQTECAAVEAIGPEIEQLVGDMFETMYTAPGRGLAAPQVGVMRRLFVMDTTWKDGDMNPLVCINPSIVPLSDAQNTNEEACLSIVGVSADVSRPNKIELSYTGLNGTRETEVLEGFAAVCAQHEMDHLNGIVIFDQLDAPERAALEAKYKEMI
ncbi:peptide deformylase [Planktotalea sp.]|uniref:peptide deformylase n=1 Tax=Planktotalea sp. TaxID=2029877 RepID=UPI0025CE961A|nr:peptide deformylase [Planktotalea sp.]